MAQQTLNNGETGLIIRGKINDNFSELYVNAPTPSWLLASGGTLTGPNTITGTTSNWIKFKFDGLGASLPTPATTTPTTFTLANETAAINGTQQLAPSFIQRGYGWGTTASTSQPVDVYYLTLPVQGTTPGVFWGLRYSVNGGALNNIISFNTTGTPTFTISHPTVVGGALTVSGGGAAITGNISSTGQFLTTFTSPTVSLVRTGGIGTIGANHVAGYIAQSSYTMRNTASDFYYSFLSGETIATGNTSQTYIPFAAGGTFNANHASASLQGFRFAVAIGGTQTATFGAIAYDHTIGYTRYGSVLSVSFDANQTDYNPTGFTVGGAPYGASRLRVTGLAADRTINSLAGGSEGRVLVIENTTAYNLLLLGDDGATGTAAMRFAGATYTIAAGRAVWLTYDDTSDRWRVAG